MAIRLPDYGAGEPKGQPKPAAGQRVVRGTGSPFLRVISRGFLLPLQYVLDIGLFAIGVLLLVAFGLAFSHSAAFDALGWVVWFHRYSDPLIQIALAGIRHIVPVSQSGVKAVPLVLSVAAWFLRSAAVGVIRRMRLVLEEPSAMFRNKARDDRKQPLASKAAEAAAPAISASASVPASASTSSSASSTLSGSTVIVPPSGAETPISRAPRPGQRIGRYEISGELGRGAMGAVYRALDPQIDRTVALKVILTRDLPPNDLVMYKERFYREARAAGKMSHPGIVTVHDIAEDFHGTPYLVMEFVEGKTLDRLCDPAAGERMTVPQCLDIAIQVAEALDYAHQQGVVHRDIKPANILITPSGHAKIADFGIAKLMGSQYTQAGAVIGTPAFMAPEQLTGAAVDSRADLFSFGVVLYWMLTGEKPFSGDTMTAITYKVVHTAPLAARQLNSALPAELDTLLMKCLAKSAAERYQTARELVGDLQLLRAGQPLASATTHA